jgi:general secretion pathway protein L
MQIGVGLILRWLAILASLVEDFVQWRRARNAVVVRKRGDEFVVERVSNGESSVMAQVAVGSALSTGVAQTLRDYAIDFELDDSEVVSRRIVVPSQAKDVLPGIVRNQMERLSPWPAAKTIYGFEAARSATSEKGFDVRILMASHRMIEHLCERLAASNLAPRRIIARTGLDRQSAPVALWSLSTGRDGVKTARLPRLIAAALATLVVLSIGVTTWALLAASDAWAERDELVAREHAFRKEKVSAAPKGPADAANQPRRAWAMKENAPAAVLVLEALARAFPDNAYLIDLSLERAIVRVTGLSPDAPPLINALQQSGQFSGVHFFAATTKDPERASYRFNIEAEVAPQLKLPGN